MTQYLYITIFILLAIIIYLIIKKRAGAGVQSLLGEIKEIRKELSEAREKSMDSMQKQLQESSKLVKDVTSQLEKIHSDHQHVKDVKGQLDKLSNILANPKQRGILGEYFLETLLKNVFQPNQYQLQYKFKDGEIVDAVIFLKDKIIPIDSKFSLENYNKLYEQKDPHKKKGLEKMLRQDLKKRIDETAKYIRPTEKTTDFAFMFIPSEGIYYDLLINRVGAVKISTYDLIEYAFKEKHVIIVSPTSFYAYLQTVLQGLRALEIEESAKDIRERVETLRRHLLNYNNFLDKLGSHLSTTVNTYNKAHKEFSKIEKDTAKLTEKKNKIKPKKIKKPKKS